MAAPMNEVYLSASLSETIENLLNSSSISQKLKTELKPYTCSTNGTIPFDAVVSVQKEIKRINKQKGDGSKVPYLHELLEGSEIKIPKLQLPTRNPELEARIQKLKAEQENKKYAEMTRNVNQVLRKKEGVSFSQDVRSMNSQLISVFNFIITVGGAFAFGYKGTEYSMAVPNVPIQLCIGMVLGTVVFFADLYFLVRYNL